MTKKLTDPQISNKKKTKQKPTYTIGTAALQEL